QTISVVAGIGVSRIEASRIPRLTLRVSMAAERIMRINPPRQGWSKPCCRVMRSIDLILKIEVRRDQKRAPVDNDEVSIRVRRLDWISEICDRICHFHPMSACGGICRIRES